MLLNVLGNLRSDKLLVEGTLALFTMLTGIGGGFVGFRVAAAPPATGGRHTLQLLLIQLLNVFVVLFRRQSSGLVDLVGQTQVLLWQMLQDQIVGVVDLHIACEVE